MPRHPRRPAPAWRRWPLGLLTAAMVAAGPAAYVGLGQPAASGATTVASATTSDRTSIAAPPPFAITVLSGRADLVSDGTALVAITLPRGRADAKKVKVVLGRRNVTSRFAIRRDGRFEALLTGLRLGRTVLRATLPNGRGTRITLVNHPRGGPLLSGPQLKPWVCQAGARDAQCNQPTTYRFTYKSTNPTRTGLQPYDRANPPSDVATTRTESGQTVPFIVRVETGYMDRDQYEISAVYQPGKPWTGVAPQRQFTHKMLVFHGASCGADHTTGTAPATSDAAAALDALGKGFVTMSTALDNSGHNCNLSVQAESLIMAKEHVVENYGTLRYTIGTGCSGGSLAEQWVANAYPGVYQGLLPTCSFPDAYSTATQFLDYHLLLGYFTNPAKWDLGSGVAWSPTQMNEVLGGLTDGVQNAEVSEQAQFHVAVPTDTCAGVTDAQRYDPATNPGGTRCTIHDAAVNMFGPEPKALWGPVEKKLGRGFVRLPIDNVGVQYGLSILKAGRITPAQFVDLNVKAGGADIDTNATTERVSATGSPSLARAYRTGLINEATHLDKVAIIDCRGTNPGLFHDTYRAFAIRKRLDRAHGTHANQVIWEGPVPLLADRDCEQNSFNVMNHWLRAVELDKSRRSLPAKIIAAKPKGLGDRCYDGAGHQVSDGLCPAAVVPVEGTPRTVAGDAVSTDTNKCTLRPLDRSSYGSVSFSDAQWATLKALYPGGVCDYSKRGVAQQPTLAWLTYQRADGRVVYGGTPLGAAPRSVNYAAR